MQQMIIAEADGRMTSRQTVPAFDSFEPICITLSDEFNMLPQRYQDSYTARRDDITLRDVDGHIHDVRTRQDAMYVAVYPNLPR